MLERIHHVKGLGLLHDARGGAYGLKKASFIYSDNGRGKSTLSSLFRSCSTNTPALITNRRTIDGVNDLDVSLQFSNGHSVIFQNGNWSEQRSELIVFDADFVEQNVYSGGQVSPAQRKNLLQFALGSSAVVAQREYDQADEVARQATARVRRIIEQLRAVHDGLSLTQFQRIAEIPDADDQIAALNQRIVEAENIGHIQVKPLPTELNLPILDVDPVFTILRTSLENIDLAAEEQVKTHLESHNKPGLEHWISEGNAYDVKDDCPFCNQPLEGIELIAAYRSYFNQDYNQLKTGVARLNGLINNSCADAVIDRLKASFDTAKTVFDGWQEHLQLDELTFQEGTARQAQVELKELLQRLKHSKEANLLETIGTDEEKQTALDKLQVMLNSISETNRAIQTVVALINAYKANLAAVDIAALRQNIVNLNWTKRRHEPAVITLFGELVTAQAADTAAQVEKQTNKDALNQTMQITLGAYKDSLNVLLRNFGAQFEISNINFDYRGGLRSDYALQMRGADIALNGGEPDFRTSLSEGDKRTLAFAFFIASTEADPDLANKVVVIDDPMCSLDLNRKQQTRTILKRIHDNCQQLIVLAHDVHFLRSLRDDILRSPNANPIDVKCIKLKSVANDYSDFDGIDLDKECETAYFKSHRVLDEYLSGVAPSNMEVARTIRPMLEGYLHRRFPGRINKGQLFGQIIIAINGAQPPNPLIHAQNITDELTEINTYAGQFHHDTNPAADQVVVVDGELRTYVIRALNLVHRGAV